MSHFKVLFRRYGHGFKSRDIVVHDVWQLFHNISLSLLGLLHESQHVAKSSVQGQSVVLHMVSSYYKVDRRGSRPAIM
jgi:septum formation inhibitor-activating ATPase MinD